MDVTNLIPITCRSLINIDARLIRRNTGTINKYCHLNPKEALSKIKSEILKFHKPIKAKYRNYFTPDQYIDHMIETRKRDRDFLCWKIIKLNNDNYRTFLKKIVELRCNNDESENSEQWKHHQLHKSSKRKRMYIRKRWDQQSASRAF